MPRNDKPRLARMTLAELSRLRKNVDGAIAEKITVERRELQSRLAALDSLRDGHQARPPRSRAKNVKPRRNHPLKGRKAPVKYRGPKGETWSGRGLAPRWLVALERKGKKRNAFLIAPK